MTINPQNDLLEKIRAKKYLVEQIMTTRPSLHWWVTNGYNNSRQAYDDLKHDFALAFRSVNEAQLKLTLHNDTTIAVFDLDLLEHHRGESPATIVFDHVQIPLDTWQWFFSHVRNFGTLNTFFIASKVADATK